MYCVNLNFVRYVIMIMAVFYYFKKKILLYSYHETVIIAPLGVKQNYLSGSYPPWPNLTLNPVLKQLERRLF